MKQSDMFPSAYLKAADLNGAPLVLKMDRVEMAKFDEGNKPELHFLNAKKTLVLNITNSRMIAELYGDDSVGWRGREIELYPTRVEFSGRQVDAIRVREPAKENPPAEKPADDLPSDTLIDI